MASVSHGSGFDYADTRAAHMLREALHRRKLEGVSMRTIALKILKYKQATVLSQMASGRVAIPTKRAREIAAATGLPEAEFMNAVADQRQTRPRASQQQSTTALIGAFAVGSDDFAQELEDIAGLPLDQLSAAHKQVLRDVVSQQDPTRRWISPAEAGIVHLLRSLRPDVVERGLDHPDREKLRKAMLS